MTDFIPRPYKLSNKIQYYDWGTKNESAFIPRFLGVEAERDKPYAELWIGAHPNAPSEIRLGDRSVPLDEVIAAYGPQCLGGYVSKKFSGKLPFLLKVLSAARALSIQLHPNKAQAARLHASHPDRYPDDNHKPEIAIALDSLTAVAGFKPSGEIASTLRALPELGEFAGKQMVAAVLDAKDAGEREMAVKDVYVTMMRKSEQRESLSSCIAGIRQRLSTKKDITPEEAEFLKQHELYGADVGLLSFFFFNMVHLVPGQAIFTDAGVPHAYIEGNIVECMANSDNVVRAGLTKKFKDVDTLLEIMKYEFAPCRIIDGYRTADEVTYNTKAEEFRVTRFMKEGVFTGDYRSGDKPSIFLISGGRLEISWNHERTDHSEKFVKGESFFIPASLSEFKIACAAGAEFFMVEIP